MNYSNSIYAIAIGGRLSQRLIGSAIEISNENEILFNLAIPRVQPVCLEINDQNIFVTGGFDLYGR
jgi:hypothetical protein